MTIVKKNLKGAELLVNEATADGILPTSQYKKLVVMTKVAPAQTTIKLDPVDYDGGIGGFTNPDQSLLSALQFVPIRNNIVVTDNTGKVLRDYLDYNVYDAVVGGGIRLTNTAGVSGVVPNDIKTKYFTITIDNTPRSGIEVVSANPMSYTNKEAGVDKDGVGRSATLTGLRFSSNVFSITLPSNFPTYHIGDSGNELQVFVGGALYTVADTPSLTNKNYSEELPLTDIGEISNKGKKSNKLYFHYSDIAKKITITTNLALADTPPSSYKRYTELLQGQIVALADKLVATKTITAQDIPLILNAAPTYPDLNAMSTSVQNLLRGVTGEIIATLSRDETANGYLPLDGGVYEKAKYKRLYDRLDKLTTSTNPLVKSLAIRTQQSGEMGGGNKFTTQSLTTSSGETHSINDLLSPFFDSSIGTVYYSKNLEADVLIAVKSGGSAFQWTFNTNQSRSSIIKDKNGRFYTIKRKENLLKFNFSYEGRTVTATRGPHDLNLVVTETDGTVIYDRGSTTQQYTLYGNHDTTGFIVLQNSKREDFTITPLTMGTDIVDSRWWGNSTTDYFVLPNTFYSFLYGLNPSSMSISGSRGSFLQAGSHYDGFDVFFHIKF